MYGHIIKFLLAGICTAALVSCKSGSSISFISSLPEGSSAFAIQDKSSAVVNLESSFVTAKFDSKQNLYFEFVHPKDIQQTGKAPTPFFRIQTSLPYRVFFERIWKTVDKSQFRTQEVQIEKFKIGPESSSLDEMIYFTVQFDNENFIGKTSNENLLDGVTVKVEFKDPKKLSSNVEGDAVTASFEMYQQLL